MDSDNSREDKGEDDDDNDESKNMSEDEDEDEDNEDKNRDENEDEDENENGNDAGAFSFSFLPVIFILLAVLSPLQPPAILSLSTHKQVGFFHFHLFFFIIINCSFTCCWFQKLEQNHPRHCSHQ